VTQQGRLRRVAASASKGLLEAWLPVPEYEGLYEVSDRGRVRSFPRKGTKGGLLKLVLDKQGYYMVRLYRDGKGRGHHVHRLVALAFHDHCPPGHEACHGPAGRLDCSAENVYWGTHQRNMGPDMERDGTLRRGELNPISKLKAGDVRTIRALRGREPQHRVAARYGIHQVTVSKIQTGKRWGHLV
jgi:hypothetical protein